MKFPELPKYRYSWRSIQLEPIPDSGERITLGTIVKGEDGALIVVRLVSSTQLKNVFGHSLYGRVSEVLGLTINSAEKFYSTNDISTNWEPPVDGFYVGDSRTSLASNIEAGLFNAAKHSSILSVSVEERCDVKDESKKSSFNLQTWRKEISDRVKQVSIGLEGCFDAEIKLSGSGLPFKFGFISPKYAAHFDAISNNKNQRHDSLVKAQSKLWQLDQLRNSDQLFRQDVLELVLYRPEENDAYVQDFTEELRSEALRREIGLFTSSSSVEVANHVVKAAA